MSDLHTKYGDTWHKTDGVRGFNIPDGASPINSVFSKRTTLKTNCGLITGAGAHEDIAIAGDDPKCPDPRCYGP